ncbi:MAG: hypothetical protein J6X28_00740 [Bacilli bacterium]|nr:hypothetical protein [Bacilli bacterium]
MVKYIQVGLVSVLLFFGVFFSPSQEGKGIYYDHVEYSDNVEFYGVEGVNLSYSGSLRNLHDSYYLLFDVVNDSNVDVEITHIDGIKEDPYIQYELFYEDGSPIQEGDTLLKGEVKRLKYMVTYENPILEDSYSVDSSFHIDFEQKISS